MKKKRKRRTPGGPGVESEAAAAETTASLPHQNAARPATVISLAGLAELDDVVAQLAEATAGLPADAREVLVRRAAARLGVPARYLLRRLARRANAERGPGQTGEAKPQDVADALRDLPPDAPAGLVMPSGYRMRPDGRIVRAGDEDGAGEDWAAEEETVVSPVPLLLIGRARDADSEDVRVTLAWREGSAWHRATVARSVVADTRRIVSLADLGLPVTSTTARGMVDYLAALEQANADRLPEAVAVSALGWRVVGERRVFVLGGEAGGAARVVGTAETAIRVVTPGPGETAYAQALHLQGELGAWLDGVYRPALALAQDGRPHAWVAILSALASPLLLLLGVSGWTLHLAGNTSQGKTTALQAAASVWGYPGGPGLPARPAQLYRGWDATGVGVEQLLSYSRHLPVYLDDLNTSNLRPADAARTLYLVANGVGRVRGARDGGTRTTATWALTVISTGERLATTLTAYTGLAARVLEFYGSPMPDKATADAVRAAAGEHYGHAGPLLVKEAIRAGMSALRRLHGRWTADLARLARDEVAGRQASAWAAMALAAMLLRRTLGRAGVAVAWMPSDQKTAALVRQICLDRQAEPVQPYDLAALDALLGWCATHPADLVPLGGDATLVPPRGWAGVWQASVDGVPVLALERTRAHQILAEAGYAGYEDGQAVMRGLRERGYLVTRPDAITVPVRFGRGREAPKARCYALRWDRLAERGYAPPAD